MALGLQPPQYCEDLTYPALQDRELLSSIVGQGVVSTNSYKVVAGLAGLQVEIFNGGAFVVNPAGIMYFQSSTAALNPFNSVEVSAVNPQIAQIILRIYDVNELKISGSSYARLEWLNGTPSASATEAKMKEGIYEGAAALPATSLRLASVLVPKNATKASEFYIQDRRLWANGAFDYKMVKEAGEYSVVTGGGFTAIDSTNLSLRIECSGAPVVFEFNVGSSEGTATTGIIVPFVNGAAQTERIEMVNKPLSSPVTYKAILSVNKGSNLFKPAWKSLGAGGTKWIFSKSEGIQFRVYEETRVAQSNGTL